MHFSWNCIVRCHLVKFFRICSSVFKAHAVTWLVSLIGDKNGRPWWSPASSLSACLPAAWSPSLRSPEEPTRLVPSPLPRAPGPRSPPPVDCHWPAAPGLVPCSPRLPSVCGPAPRPSSVCYPVSLRRGFWHPEEAVGVALSSWVRRVPLLSHSSFGVTGCGILCWT